MKADAKEAAQILTNNMDGPIDPVLVDRITGICLVAVIRGKEVAALKARIAELEAALEAGRE